jgi:CHAD domain-containing protein
MAKAREIPGLADAASFREAAARAVEVRADEVFEHSENVLDVEDIERVHDMRVATRRLRAVMEIFAPCFPKDHHRALLREVKSLADVLGERRDRDVAIAAMERIADALATEDRPGLAHLVDELRAEQQGANATLAEALEEVERSDLRNRLRALVAEASAV